MSQSGPHNETQFNHGGLPAIADVIVNDRSYLERLFSTKYLQGPPSLLLCRLRNQLE